MAPKGNPSCPAPGSDALRQRPVGIFDSGLGGLTALRVLREILPGEDFVYFGDTGRVPYGNRGAETIREYARQDAKFLLSHCVKMIVVACGTVTTNVDERFAAALPVPVVDVLSPAVAAAARATRNRRVGVIATAATIASGAFQRALGAALPGGEIFAAACPLFVPLVENGLVERDNPITREVVKMYLAPLRAAGIDTLVLGCTHYPLIEGLIADFMGEGVALISAGAEAARSAKEAIVSAGLAADRGAGGATQLFVSDTPDGFLELASRFLGEELTHAERVSVANL